MNTPSSYAGVTVFVLTLTLPPSTSPHQKFPSPSLVTSRSQPIRPKSTSKLPFKASITVNDTVHCIRHKGYHVGLGSYRCAGDIYYTGRRCTLFDTENCRANVGFVM